MSRALDPRVVGDLVVGEEGRVDDRAAGEHVADDGRDLEVALDDRRPGADERVACGRGGSAAARRRATWPRAARRSRTISATTSVEGLERPRRDGRSRRRSRARSAAAGVSTVLIVSIECGASPERMLARLAPSACSSPRPSEWRRSSSSASRGWLVTIARAAVLLPPAEGGHVVVVAVQQARPGRRRSARTSRSPSARAGGSRRAIQRARFGALPSAQRALRGRRGRGRRSRGRRRPARRSRSTVSRRAAPAGRTTLRYQALVVVDREQREVADGRQPSARS